MVNQTLKGTNCDDEKDITQVSLEEYKIEEYNELNKDDLHKKHPNSMTCELAAFSAPTDKVTNAQINKKRQELVRDQSDNESYDLVDTQSPCEMMTVRPPSISHDSTSTTILERQERTLSQDEFQLSSQYLRRSLSFSSIPSELNLSPNYVVAHCGAQEILEVPCDISKPASNELIGNKGVKSTATNSTNNFIKDIHQPPIQERPDGHSSRHCSGVSDSDFWRDCEREGDKSPRDQRDVVEDISSASSISTRLGFLWRLPSILSTETATSEILATTAGSKNKDTKENKNGEEIIKASSSSVVCAICQEELGMEDDWERHIRKDKVETGLSEFGVRPFQDRLNIRVRVLPCNHVFHDLCISEWLMKCQGICPLCKRDLTQDLMKEATCCS
ncbi:uncharacterized protein SAPINGB_P003583 [Magnusiomyces paraingens]|uniref:RING-type domain-containing protein n=1 Tax=Magnusiomyces paraingens TaxID=2606893 RepID=A0A5E8BVH2_9ASCO|nr:uncharacterized protein SAPINGB_P003583 [Saprochaete ingens]VVT53457.1 unnamed protein product [Saprochaete ingens]